MLAENIFLKIINRQIPAKLIHEDDLCIAFHDIHPQAPTHILIIPKKEIRTHDDIGEEDEKTLGRMHMVAKKIVKKDNP